jgi:opacity protein-like surface antigen
MFGYRYDFGKVSVFAKGGPAASFLVHKNMPVQSPEEGARIVNVDYQVPARSQVNWQLVFGAGIGYDITDNVSFNLEPTFRYALKSEYSLSGNENGGANSFGIRLGLNYNF